MNIEKGIKIIDLGLYLTKYKTLIIADSHIGYEEALNKQGILIPRFHFKDLIKRLEKILKKAKPKTIIINGDIKHEFGRISEQEWRYTLRLIDFLAKRLKISKKKFSASQKPQGDFLGHCKNLFLIKGNHDKQLGPIAKKRKIKTADNIILDDILITHGNKIPKIPKNIKTIIIGHEHPAVGLREQTRTETYKCFLKGKYQNKTLIVQPSFNLITEGTNILKEKTISPFLKHNLKNFECYIVADKVYKFGKLKNL